MNHHVAGLVCLIALVPALMGNSCGSGGLNTPVDQGYASRPEDAAPTGTRWEDVTVEDACGRAQRVWFLVDEACGGRGHDDYFDGFAAPMFRDGVFDGNQLFTVDATNLWTLDVDPDNQLRHVSLVSGLGQPLAVARRDTTLLLASAEEGLVLVDVSDPGAPTRSGQVALGGPAMDVAVQGDVAYLAAGDAGLVMVDLAQSSPRVSGRVQTPGYAVGVTVHEGRAYVAACETLAIVDLASRSLLGSTWFDEAWQGGTLVAPAKDVEIVVREASGTVPHQEIAFVAAGRFGSVAVDVTSPEAPSVLGNCTVADDLAFYASGLKSQGDQLHVAGGEWGILSLNIEVPDAACSELTTPALYSMPASPSGECSQETPWELLATEDLWEPPLAGHDPLQVLPAGDRLFAFGDATRVGLRSVDVHQLAEGALTKVGRYEEPRRITGIAASHGRLLALGPSQGLYALGQDLQLQRLDSVLPESLDAGAFIDDGRWVAGRYQQLFVEGAGAAIDLGPAVAIRDFHAHGQSVVSAQVQGVLVFDVETSTQEMRSADQPAALPPTAAIDASGVYMAAPEWAATQALDAGGSRSLAPHAVFDAADALDIDQWRYGPPRRNLVSSSQGLLEVASLGGRAGATLHGAGGSAVRLALPFAPYVAGVSRGSRVYLIAGDRARYRSQLVTIAIDETGMQIEGIRAFAGVAEALAIDGDRLFVADADRGVRLFDLEAGLPRQIAVLPLEVQP